MRLTSRDPVKGWLIGRRRTLVGIFIESLREKGVRWLGVIPGMSVIVLSSGLRKEWIEIQVLISWLRHLVLHIVSYRAVLEDIIMTPIRIWRKKRRKTFSRVIGWKLLGLSRMISVILKGLLLKEFSLAAQRSKRSLIVTVRVGKNTGLKVQ